MNRFFSFAILLITALVCLLQRKLLSKYTPKCFISLTSGILDPAMYRRRFVCSFLCLVKLIRLNFEAENLNLHFVLYSIHLSRYSVYLVSASLPSFLYVRHSISAANSSVCPGSGRVGKSLIMIEKSSGLSGDACCSPTFSLRSSEIILLIRTLDKKPTLQ